MRRTKLFCSAVLVVTSIAFETRATDVGLDIPAVNYIGESAPDDETVIRDMGSKIGYIRNTPGRDEYWTYTALDFGGPVTHLTVRASSATAGGTLRVALANHYNPMTTIATVEITNTGGWDQFQEFTVPVDEFVIGWLGNRNLFFVVEDDGNPDYKFDIESFRFEDRTNPLVAAASYDIESYPSDESNIRDMGFAVGYIQHGGWVRYSQFDLGAGASELSVWASSNTSGGTLYVTTQAPMGFGAANLLAVVDIGPTAGWDDFQEFTAEVLNDTSGVVSNLYLTFEGDSGYLFDVQAFQFR